MLEARPFPGRGVQRLPEGQSEPHCVNSREGKWSSVGWNIPLPSMAQMDILSDPPCWNGYGDRGPRPFS